jgi:hypothetical protein
MFISHLPSALFKVFSHLLLVVTFDNLSSRHQTLSLQESRWEGSTATIHRRVPTASLRNICSGIPLQRHCVLVRIDEPRTSARALSNHQSRKYFFCSRHSGISIDDGRRFVAQPLARSQQPLAELAVLAADLATGAGAKIGSKAAVFLKQLPSKGHVGAKRSLGELTSLVAEVEKSKGTQCVRLFKR